MSVARIDVEAESDYVPDVATDLHQNGTTTAASRGTRSVEILMLRHVVLQREHGLPVLVTMRILFSFEAVRNFPPNTTSCSELLKYSKFRESDADAASADADAQYAFGAQDASMAFWHGAEPHLGEIQEEIKSNGWKLWIASRNGNLEEVKEMLSHDFENINYRNSTDGLTALQVAAIHGHHDVVRELRDKGAST